MSIYDVLLQARRLGLSVEAILMFFMLSVHAKCSLAFFVKPNFYDIGLFLSL